MCSEQEKQSCNSCSEKEYHIRWVWDVLSWIKLNEFISWLHQNFNNLKYADVDGEILCRIVQGHCIRKHFSNVVIHGFFFSYGE